MLGAPLALLLARGSWPGQSVLRALVLVPLVLPPVVGGLALLTTFGRRGLGLFFAPAALAGEVAEQFGAVLIGKVPSVREQFYMISNDRKIKHPAVEAILAAAQTGELGAG